MDIQELTLDEWDELLPATGFEVFHTRAALAVIDEYASGDLHLLGGFRGQESVALFPLFVRNQWSLEFVLSPPPGLSVPRLGPVLMPTSPKQRKRDELNKQFVEGTLEWADVNSSRTLFGMVGSPEYTDPRPYHWTGFGVRPRFSNALHLENRTGDDVLGSFSSDLRREIRKRDEIDVSIDLEGAAQAKRVCKQLRERHVEQGLTFPTPEPFVGDIVDELGERARVYVARGPDGEFLSGIVVLYSNDAAIFWLGGAKANYDGVSVNSLLHWAIIEDLLTDEALDSIERYDLGNVNNRRIARYKSKFNAEIVPNYEVKSTLMTVAKKAYSIRRHLQW